VADIIVFDAQTNMSTDALRVDGVLRLFKEIYELPNYVHMADGRKWNRLPLVIGQQDMPITSAIPIPFGTTFLDPVTTMSSWDVNPIDEFYGRLVEDVTRYRRQLLDEYSNLGFLVSLHAGRYRVGPALKPRSELESSLYYGAGDKRDEKRFWTVDRELYGIEREIEEFESLLNRGTLQEEDIQGFLEDHPHFLGSLGGGSLPMPHPYLTAHDGALIIPDFVLKPVIAPRRDSGWKVLDLKLPNKRIIVGRGKDTRLSHDVMAAIRQLHRYRDYFSNPVHKPEVERVFGQPLFYPRLAVMIGRMPEVDEALQLEREQREFDVEIVTYDEVIETQRRIYEIQDTAKQSL
jgi:hypothetical protein